MTLLQRFENLSLTLFLEEIEINDYFWIAKRLSGNDTGLTGGHQVGVYFPRTFFQLALPEICQTDRYNPDAFINKCYFPAQQHSITGLRAIYYNSKFFPEKGLQKQYDEFRLTRWGGKTSPVQNVENTGAIFILAISKDSGNRESVGWVASTVEEENLIESWLGREVEPGRFVMPDYSYLPQSNVQLPDHWLNQFPAGEEIFKFVLQQLPRENWERSIDDLLLKRRELEFQVFEKIEQNDVLPKIINGFNSVEEFVKYSLSVSNRRKSRTGKSLELNLESIFIDEKLFFETQVTTENKKKPDFIFPSGKAYHDKSFSQGNLNMMAAKTCCKDRWRQILNETNRIEAKHLFTLQQGVSGNQLREMSDNNVSLVVPETHLGSFPREWRNSLLTLTGFVNLIQKQQSGISNVEQWIS